MNALQEGGNFELLPWQEGLWERLWQAHRDQRLPHGLLLTGQSGMGKCRFARCLAQALFCRHPSDHGVPCGQCRNCRLFVAGTYPDYHLIEPEEDAKTQEIKVDAIRELSERGVLTSSSGGQKVIVIAPADHMNTAAANSLLKTLEEPVPATLLVLVSSQPHKLPATVRSRCQRSEIFADRGQANAWLAQQTKHPQPQLLLDLASGSPLTALALAEPEVLRERGRMLAEFAECLHGRQDPVAVAERWVQLEPLRVLSWISGWLLDMLRLKHSPDAALFNSDQRDNMRVLAQRADSKRLYRLLDEVLEGRRQVTSPLSKQLMLESILITWVECRSH
jgi:DNA polymerase-3 subunit delta'